MTVHVSRTIHYEYPSEEAARLDMRNWTHSSKLVQDNMGPSSRCPTFVTTDITITQPEELPF